MRNYQPTIGIEVHVEVKSKSKLFSSSENNYGLKTNAGTNVIDLGYPGTLPTVNEEVIKQGIRAAHVLHCQITREMHFDRKNYFYPDNPKNYQITQNRTPIGRNGYLDIVVDGLSKRIEIEEMHIEEDTCKSAHRGNVSLLDFNRAGVPLIEIVTKPCITSSQEAMAYLEKLKELLFYTDISDCKMEEGSMRCDANVSISTNDVLGIKCEIKNIGSIHNVGLSIEKEIKRQVAVLEQGEVLKEQTRRFDDKLQETVLMRYKETGNDYRYFPEPDIPFIRLTDDFINEALKSLPILPDALRTIYQSHGLSLLQSNKLLANRSLSNYFTQLLDEKTNYVAAANLLLGDVAAYLNKHNITIDQTMLSIQKLTAVLALQEQGQLSSKNIKELLTDLLETNQPLETLIASKNIQNISDDNVILEVINRVLATNDDSVKDYHAGKDRAFKYLMGQVMKETKGSINPKMASDLLIQELKK